MRKSLPTEKSVNISDDTLNFSRSSLIPESRCLKKCEKTVNFQENNEGLAEKR